MIRTVVAPLLGPEEWMTDSTSQVICVALFSYARERFESIYYPRIKACKEQKASGSTESGEQSQFTHETPEVSYCYCTIEWPAGVRCIVRKR